MVVGEEVKELGSWSVGWIIYIDVEITNLNLCMLPHTRVVLGTLHSQGIFVNEELFHMTIKLQFETSFSCAQVRQK